MSVSLNQIACKYVFDGPESLNEPERRRWDRLDRETQRAYLAEPMEMRKKLYGDEMSEEDPT